MSGRDILKHIPSLKDNELNILKDAHPYTALFGSVDELTKDDIVVKPNCKFCHHPARKEAEEAFEKSGRVGFAKVEKFIRDYEAIHTDVVKISYSCIKNHLQKHYLLQEKQIQMREYAQRHTAWMNKKVGDDQKLDALKSALEMMFVEIASDDTLFVLKRAETMTKLSKSIVDIITMQSKLKGDIDVASVLTEKFTAIWTNLIGRQTDEILKRSLMTALEDFQEQINGIQTESIVVK